MDWSTLPTVVVTGFKSTVASGHLCWSEPFRLALLISPASQEDNVAPMESASTGVRACPARCARVLFRNERGRRSF